MNDITNGVPPNGFSGGASTIIKEVVYRSATQRLQISLHTGRTYGYADVPISCYVAFFRASSRGAFFNHYIKGKFKLYYNDGRETAQAAPRPRVEQGMAQVLDFFAAKYDAIRGRSRWDHEWERQGKGGLWAKYLADERARNNKQVKATYRLKGK